MAPSAVSSTMPSAVKTSTSGLTPCVTSKPATSGARMPETREAAEQSAVALPRTLVGKTSGVYLVAVTAGDD